jgi:amino-acid N-acetyltransferase
MTIVIEQAHADDIPAVLTLLEESELPVEGLDALLGAMLVARKDQGVVGSAALELYGGVALLRSVAVAPSLRGQQLGKRLVEAALDLARLHNIEIVYLLTETAQSFFPRFGFRPIPRSEVSPVLHQSIEWTTACPATAQVMITKLASQGEKIYATPS